MNENFDEFDKYVMNYDMNEDMIKYKYNHSYRVVHQVEELCRSLELDTDERDLASNIALLHDIARFRQWTDYKTFQDYESFDHGDEGVKILFDEGEIKKYNINEDDYDVLKKAIKYHNKFKIDSKNLNEREKLHCKIIRDADKLDILYAFSTNRLLELTEDDGDIGECIKDDFFNHVQTLSKYVVNKNERIIELFGFIYDLNFDYSKERVLNEKYIDKIYNHLKNKKLFKPYRDEIIKFLKGGK